MVEIKPNMYVRTKNGIAKVIKIDSLDMVAWTNKRYIYFGVCSKDNLNFEVYDDGMVLGVPSYDIIDLIEAGDILIISDFVDEACMIFDDIYYIQNDTQLLNIKNDLEKNKNKRIKSIVTHEQFESISYKVD